MLTDFTSFYEFIEPRVPGGVPDTALERGIRDAAIELYRDLNWLQEVPVAPINLIANQPLYEIQSPEPEMAVVGITRMLCNNVPVAQKERPWLDQFAVQPWETQTSSTPNYYIVLGYDDVRMQIQLVPFPNASTTAQLTTGLTIRVTLAPTNVATRLDGSAFTMMKYAIAAWVLRDLAGQRGMPWFDREAETLHDAELLKYKTRLTLQREIGQGKMLGTITTGQFGIYTKTP